MSVNVNRNGALRGRLVAGVDGQPELSEPREEDNKDEKKNDNTVFRK